MPEEPNEITQQIAQTRQNLGKHLQEFDAKVHRTVNIQKWVTKKPALLAAGAVALGILFVRFISARARS